MAKDVTSLRAEAAEAVSTGKYKRALAVYLELERLEPHDAQWAKRAGETYRRLGNTKHAIEAFNRSVERYAQNGFLVQAIAVCKIILHIAPNHADTLRRLAQMNEQIGAGPTRAGTMADNNPTLHANPNVAALRRSSGATVQPRMKPSTPPVSTSRTKSRPIRLPEGAPLEHVQLSKEVPEAGLRDATQPGIHHIPIEEPEAEAEVESSEEMAPPGEPVIEPVEDDPPIVVVEPGAAFEPELDELAELDLEDIEEIPLPEPRAIGQAAQRALAATPLFAGLPSEALEALVGELALVPLEQGEFLFREGDPSDALYVLVEGEVALEADGPPRVEMARLGPGSFLGEVALLTDQPRAVTVTALVPSELLRIDRVTLSRVLGNSGDLLRPILRFVRDRIVDRWMRTSPLFRPFDDAQRAQLASRFNFLEIDAGTTLLGAGQRPDGLYIILGGQFVVIRGGLPVATLGPGDLIGETALLSGGAFRSDVVAKGKSLALCLPAAVFREVIMTHPHVLEYIGEQAEHSRRLKIL
jgi:CRP-like cAMP-binding protein